MAVNVEAFYNMINGIAKQTVDASRTDKTIDAVISKLYNADIGEYKVEYQGNIFSAFVPDPTVEYQRDERVYVLVPEGDFSRKKIILGRSAYQNALSDDQVNDLSNFYIPVGPNFLGEDYYLPIYDPLEICAISATDKGLLDFRNGDGARYGDFGFLRWPFFEVKENTNEPVVDAMRPLIVKQDQTRYPATFMTEDVLAKIDEEFQNYSAVSTHLCLSANFQTKFLQQHSNGEYALKATFIVSNPKYRQEGDPQKEERAGEKPYELVTYTLDFKSFNGSPYQLPQSTPQKAYFDITKGGLLGLYSLQLWQDGQMWVDIMPFYDGEGNLILDDPEKAITDKNNIIATNFSLQFQRKVDMLDTPFYCWIETPQGTQLRKSVKDVDGNLITPGRESLSLIPHMIFKKQDVTKDCRFMWFREDLNIPDEYNPSESDRDENGRVYTYYTGNGWRPIEHYIENELMTSYQINKDTSVLTINREYEVNGTLIETIPWQWRYKLVAVYGEEVFGFDTVIIKNADTKYDLFIESFAGTGTGQFLRINDNNALVGKDIDPNGLPDPSILHEGDNVFNNYYPEWFGDWYYELADNSYNEASTPYFHGPLDINSLTMYEHIRFRVMAYDPHHVCPPTGILHQEVTNGQFTSNMIQAQPVGILEYEIMAPQAGGLLIEWEGEKSFNYTALNKAYDSAYNKDHKLAVKVNWVHGDEKTTGYGQRYDVYILAPDGQQLANQSYYNSLPGNDAYVDEGLGHEVANSMMTVMYVDSKNVIHFKLKDQYNINYTENTYTAVVHTFADDKWYQSTCPIIFTKDGQGGTQGSEWSAPVRLTNTKAMQHKPVNFRGQEVAGYASEPFTLMVNNLRPLIIKRTGVVAQRDQFEEYDMPGYTGYNSDGSSYHGPQLVIRPFVTKEGRALESIADIIESAGDEDTPGLRNDHKHYKIIAHWDVRFPQNAALKAARGRSFLTLVNPLTGQPFKETDEYGTGDGKTCTTVWTGITSEQEYGDKYNFLHNAVGIKFNKDGFGETVARKAFDKFMAKWELTCKQFGFEFQSAGDCLVYQSGEEPTGVRPFEDWPKQAQEATKQDGVGINGPVDSSVLRLTSDVVKEYIKLKKAALEEATFDDISFEEMSYNFVVKCEIEIHTDLETNYRVLDENGMWGQDGVSSNKGVIHPLKTIVAYYPVDVFICDTDIKETDQFNVNTFFNETFMNWPTEVVYDSRGNNPVANSDKLEFFIDFQKDNQEKTMEKMIEPMSLTPLLATVERQDEALGLPKEQYVYQQNLRDELVGNERSLSTFTWIPRAHLNWQEGIVATLMGEINYNYRGVLLLKGNYYRNQIYHLNSFENVDINGWDGQGIDIDEENGTIFAPTIGAGFKGVFSNRFTGVLMGINKGFPRANQSKEAYNQFFLDPFNPTDTEKRELAMNPFMTGLFGYQQGQTSFALLENGTAFFGRADRGGRIIIDGYNATIYGGANGELGSPEIGDPMWNNMRINLVDLTHSVGAPNVNGQSYSLNGKSLGMNDGEWSASDWDSENKSKGRDYPIWYDFIWRHAYISKRGQLPWYLDPEWGLGEGYCTYGLDEDDSMRSGDKKYRDESTYPGGHFKDLPDFYAGGNGYGPGYKDMSASTPNKKINYWLRPGEGTKEELTQQERDQFAALLMGAEERKDADGNDVNYGSLDGTHPLTGFGPSRASTTPAIEIGQHPEGLCPGLLPWGSAEFVLKNSFIPGDRNFMVTYDGTLWAMNGVFMGNVIGSNIVGGRLQGVEMGVGVIDHADQDVWMYDEPNCNWKLLISPYVTKKHIIADLHANGAFSVSPDGEVLCRSIMITGGSIDIGTFHIAGTEKGGKEAKGSGALLQTGESDFIGPTHFYGNVGIGPLLFETHKDRDGSWGYQQGLDQLARERNGNLLQTNGIVALGIYLPLWPDFQPYGHNRQQKLAAVTFHETITENNRIVGTGTYLSTTHDVGDPGILNMSKAKSVEQIAMFSVNTRSWKDFGGEESARNLIDFGNDRNQPAYLGHFWPLAFRYADVGVTEEVINDSDSPTKLKGKHAYFTMMDIFQSNSYSVKIGKENAGSSGGEEGKTGIQIPGGNYFRVGPWGMEASRMYVCASWQKEQKSEVPSPARRDDNVDAQYGVRGIFGIVDRDGTSGATKDKTLSPAIGITSWGKAPIILTSDDNFSTRVAGASYLQFFERDEEVSKQRTFDSAHKPTGCMIHGVIGEEGIVFDVASNDTYKEHQEKYKKSKGTIRLTTSIRDVPNLNKSTTVWPENMNGLLLDPENKMQYQLRNNGIGGTYLWAKLDQAIHIFQEKKDKWTQDGIKGTELFLYRGQASLIGEDWVYIGTNSQDYAGADDSLKASNSEGQKVTLTHVPNTKKGSGIRFSKSGWRAASEGGFSITVATDLIADKNGGYSGEANPVGGIGMDLNHSEYFHKNYITIHRDVVGKFPGANVPGIGVGWAKSAVNGNYCWIGDGAGGMEGLNGKLYMRDQWAIPDNQFCIYARFG